MSCAKVKRKNIPEFYFCEKCKINGPATTTASSSSSSTDESIGEKSSGSVGKATTKGSIKGELKVKKQKKVSAKAAAAMYNRVNNQTSDKSDNFMSALKKSSVNGMRKLKKIRKMGQSLSAKMPTSTTTKKYLSKPGPTAVAASRSATVTSVNTRIMEVSSESAAVPIDSNGHTTDSSITQKSLNNNNNIYHSELPESTNGTQTNGQDTNTEFYSKRAKLS
jgi:hypothetical protein